MLQSIVEVPIALKNVLKVRNQKLEIRMRLR